MQNTGVLAIATTPSLRSNLCTDNITKVRRNLVISSSSSLDFSSTSTDTTTTTTTSNNSLEQQNSLKFSYSRASPSVRWPHMKFPNNPTLTQQPTQLVTSPPPPPPPPPRQEIVELDDADDDVSDETDSVDDEEEEETQTQTLDSLLDKNDERQEVLGRPNKTKKKVMSKLALKRAEDWRIRVQILTDKILELQPGQFVADVLDRRIVQMTPNDYCYVVKWVGMSNWQRALEVYEWLNIHHWFNPTGRMVATILSVLGKANQESLAEEIFTRVDGGTENIVQVYNAMMGVYSRRGRFSKVQELLDLMQTRGCEPDLVSFNTLINARAKSGPMTPGLAMQLLDEVRKARLRPDTITYNTLISSCSHGSNLEEAVKIYRAMEASKCQPDLWTYNAMISVYSRCGMAWEADRLFQDLGSKGFFADAVTYNSLLYAFAREGNVEKVREICDQMVKVGYAKDEMTYNTIIHMHGKCGQHDLSWQTYRDMKLSGCNPDAITYTVLIDSLGKAGMIVQAAEVMSEMLDSGVKPTLRTFSALICGYAKAGMRVEAEETFCCMLRSGIKPDHLAYSIMLDILLRSNLTKKAMSLYETMVRDGFQPDQGLYEVMLQTLAKEKRENDFERVVKDMEKVFGMRPEIISSLLVKGECHEYAIKMLKLAVSRGYEPDRETFLSVLNSYESSDVQLEARALLDTLRKYAPRSNHLITEASILMLCKDHQLDAAMVEYNKAGRFGLLIYESLIRCFKEAQSFEQASQVYSDMKFYGVEPSQTLYRSLVHIYCGMGFPETGHHLVDLAESSGIRFNDISIYVDLIEAYGKLKVLQGAESLVGRLRMKYSIVDRKIWNALIHAYAASGRYEQARAVLSTMMRDGPSPTVESINGLMQALIVDERLPELYVVIQELQDMGFKISKSSILLMLDAFARAGNIFEVKKIYHGMKAAGYLPTMHLYRSMIQLLSRGKRIQDVEAMVLEMEEAGFKPDLSIFNSLLKLYTGIGNFKKTSAVYQSIQEAGLNADEDTYNILILMYSRDLRPEEGLSLLHKMKQQGLTPKLDTYKSLMSACCKQQLWEQSEGLFEELRSKGFKLDRSVYHMLMKMYRDSANHLKAKSLLVRMKEEGVEPTIATMHLLMVSYGSARQPKEAENVLNTLKSLGVSLSTLPYSSVIDAYLKNGDSNLGIQKLFEMKEEGLEPDHRIWTCFIRAASLSQSTSGAMVLLNALRDTGFDLPVRLLTEKTESLVDEVDSLLEQLGPLEDNAAFNFVNALEDLLWAFERRATASWILQLAVKRSVYRHDMFRVADKDWGADFRKMSPGAALVGLTLWLDYMQDASLQGSPESPKSVVLITGMAEYNMVSLNNTVKAYLWEMGSPFFPCKTRSGLLIAKAHSLRMWLKDSPFCLDLELKDAPHLPDLNSMQLSEGYFMRRGLVPVLKQITERLGQVRPKKFARLALLTDDQREMVIQADIDGRAEKLEKMKERGKLIRPKKKKEKINRRYGTLN